MSTGTIIGLVIGTATVAFLFGAYFGILAYRMQLGRKNDRDEIAIYMPPDAGTATAGTTGTRVDNDKYREPTARIKK